LPSLLNFIAQCNKLFHINIPSLIGNYSADFLSPQSGLTRVGGQGARLRQGLGIDGERAGVGLDGLL
jgi:hypothetical protein